MKNKSDITTGIALFTDGGNIPTATFRSFMTTPILDGIYGDEVFENQSTAIYTTASNANIQYSIVFWKVGKSVFFNGFVKNISGALIGGGNVSIFTWKTISGGNPLQASDKDLPPGGANLPWLHSFAGHNSNSYGDAVPLVFSPTGLNALALGSNIQYELRGSFPSKY